MTPPPCTTCVFSIMSEVQGRDRLGCLRRGMTPDGKFITPPKYGFETAFERSPLSPLDWRAPETKCGPQGKFHEARPQ
jgi:hypothetical protein